MSKIDPREFLNALRNVTPQIEIDILSSQIEILSFNVIEKHAWFNRGYKFFVAGLLCLLLTIASYIFRIYNTPAGGFSQPLALASIALIVFAAIVYWWLDDHEKRREAEFQAKFQRPAGSNESPGD